MESEALHFKEANYHCKMGEIDLIMIDGGTLVFVEVRYRESQDFCNPLETITRSKQRKIIKAASHYLTVKMKTHNIPCRFDAVGVTKDNSDQYRYQWIKSAFY